MRNVISGEIKDALKEMGLKADVLLEHPADLKNGDYSTPVAFSLAKELKEKPIEVARKIKEKLGEIDGVLKVEVAGTGFLNFFLSKKVLSENIKNAAKNEKYGGNGLYSGKRIMIEYTDPNPFKLFHIGHLMSNSIGESLSRLLEFSGASVIRANYQGDVGLHVAKTIYGIFKLKSKVPPKNSPTAEIVEFLGEAYVLGAGAYEGNPEAKGEIETINKKIFDRSDGEINEYYKWGREASLAHFEEIYEKLGTKFDRYFFESEVAEMGAKIVKENIGKVFEESDGAVIFAGDKYGLHKRVFITSQGLPTYEAKEIGLTLTKFEKENPDLSIAVTANEQDDYFKVVLKALEILYPKMARKTMHFGHGMMRLPSGKMASRRGNVISGESLLAEVEHLVLEKIKDRDLDEAKKAEIVQKVAIAAVKCSILKQSIGKDIHFDFKKSISFEGDSGPYILYSYVRAKSVLAKAGGKAPKTSVAPDKITDLERMLFRFPDVAERAMEEFAPHRIASYLLELSSVWNAFYMNCKILGDKEEEYRLTLTKAVSNVLAKGMWLLGIETVEKM